jgi:hypothetical protein
MVIAILEPVCAGIMVALINKYLLNNLGGLCQSCSVEEIMVDENEAVEEEEEGSAVSSSTTTISDVGIHVHCHT